VIAGAGPFFQVGTATGIIGTIVLSCASNETPCGAAIIWEDGEQTRNGGLAEIGHTATPCLLSDRERSCYE
jgi:hypothetical protein